jgi:hypothetical protein
VGRDDVPKQHVLLETELGQHAVNDRRGRLRRAGTGELALGRERQARDAGAPVSGRLADEDDRRVRAALKIGGQAFSAEG